MPSSSNRFFDDCVLASNEQVPPGKSELRMTFAKTIPITYSIEETFDVGEDTGSPIIEDVYAVPFRNLALKKLTVKIDK